MPAGIYQATTDDIQQYLQDVVIRARTKTAIGVLYIQPCTTGAKNVMGFQEFGTALPADDPVAGIFKEYLVRWTEPAGAVRPQHELG